MGLRRNALQRIQSSSWAFPFSVRLPRRQESGRPVTRRLGMERVSDMSSLFCHDRPRREVDNRDQSEVIASLEARIEALLSEKRQERNRQPDGQHFGAPNRYCSSKSSLGGKADSEFPPLALRKPMVCIKTGATQVMSTEPPKALMKDAARRARSARSAAVTVAPIAVRVQVRRVRDGAALWDGMIPRRYT